MLGGASTILGLASSAASKASRRVGAGRCGFARQDIVPAPALLFHTGFFMVTHRNLTLVLNYSSSASDTPVDEMLSGLCKVSTE